MKQVYIETLGCQMNKSDTERMLGILSHFGYTQTQDEKTADLLMINTCSIRQLSEDKAFSKIGSWGKRKKENKNIKIGFCGCVAQQKSKELFKRAPYVDFVLGTHAIYKLPEIIKRVEFGEKVCECTETPAAGQDFEIKRVKSVNAWIPITEGCNNFCTYCIVPYTRGRERSRPPGVILKEAREALAQGFKEITLLGQNVDSYCAQDYRLADLLRDLNKLDGKFRIRFVTSYPSDITDELIKTAVELDKVCEYFHIPMQSGSNEVLKAMNRRYTAEAYAEICAKIRKTVPDVTITSDFIAGFPGETEEQFQETLSAMEELELDYSNTAAYSPREKTTAAKWTDRFLPEKVKTERLARLNEQNKKNCLKSNQKFTGRTMEVLVENFYNHKGKNVVTGRTRNNKIVHIPSETDLTGEFITVKITNARTWYLNGEIKS
ncbi:MAG: tRNA (N6-isopentenyl adenosine(37)-C2)-methylthiotransferase MiaB [Heliobacteriaceae bacterium]|jgi:tRNA-2-methylthio-N6-dimethylallyladenosine synthase|nr:tRNA (N6-isopentenyl adenosine(37)-C2)-methylthiotransferase MiaB [Heliobacteriaceae bacterium]